MDFQLMEARAESLMFRVSKLEERLHARGKSDAYKNKIANKLNANTQKMTIDSELCAIRSQLENTVTQYSGKPHFRIYVCLG